jgi:hypothetical protein
MLVALAVSASRLRMDIVEISQNKSDTVLGEIHGLITVGQSFLSAYAGLNAIEVLMATYARTNTNDLIFHLRHAPESSEDIRVSVTNSTEIDDNSYHRFAFPPIPDSENQSYYFFMESPRAVPGNAVTVYFTASDTYEGGSAFLNHKRIAGDLTFKVYREARLQDAFATSFRGLFACFCARVPAETYFFAPYFALLIVLTTVTVKLQLESRRRQKSQSQPH